MIFQDACPAAQDPVALKPKLCEQFGLCVCRGNGARALEFHRRFTALLRPYFTPPRKRKDQTLSADQKARRSELLGNRRLLTQGFLVARLCLKIEHKQVADTSLAQERTSNWARVAARASVSALCNTDLEDAEIWLHLGYVNFRNWFFSGLLLKRAGTVETAEGVRLTRLEVDPEARFDWCLPLFHKVQFELPCFLQLHQIFSDEASLTDREMKPDWVLVSEFAAVPGFRVWKGEAEEAQDRARKKPRSKPAGTRPKRPGSSGPAASAAKRARRSGHQPLGVEDDPQQNNALEDVTVEEELEQEADAEDDLLQDELWREDEDEDASVEGDEQGDDLALAATESEASVLCDQDDENEDSANEEKDKDKDEPVEKADAAEEDASSSDDSDSEKFDPGSRRDAEPASGSAAPALRPRGTTSHGGAQRRRPKLAKDVAVHFAEHGELRYNIRSKTIVAICGNKAHGAACKRTRTCRKSNREGLQDAGQGRPVGLLAAWLMQSHKHSSSEAHREAIGFITSAQRREARAAFTAVPDAEAVLDMERKQSRKSGEGDEPDFIR